MPATRVGVDKTIGEADPADYDGLLLPGGFINPDLFRQSAEARQFVRAFATRDKPIATLCHGPWVLASAGLLDGRTLTSWPGIRDDLVNSGATWLDRALVKDGNLVTSRGPQDMTSFVPAVLDHFSDTTSETPAGSSGSGLRSTTGLACRLGRRCVALVAEAVDTRRRRGSDGRCAARGQIEAAKSLLLSRLVRSTTSEVIRRRRQSTLVRDDEQLRAHGRNVEPRDPLDACRYRNMIRPWHEQRRRRTSSMRSPSRSVGRS